MGRTSLWQQTLPFALNNDFMGTEAFETETFELPRTNVVSTLTEWWAAGQDPSGWRHRTDHPSFIRVLASGLGPQSASLDYDSFDLQSTDISVGSGVSKTKAMLFRVHSVTSPGQTRVSNMRVWASDTTDFLEPQTHRILFHPSDVWNSGFLFQAGDIGERDYWMPTSLPYEQNLFRNDQQRVILGSGDADVSQWMYVALAASGTMPLGEYGDTTDGPGGFNLRVTYNVDNLGLVSRFYV